MHTKFILAAAAIALVGGVASATVPDVGRPIHPNATAEDADLDQLHRVFVDDQGNWTTETQDLEAWASGAGPLDSIWTGTGILFNADINMFRACSCAFDHEADGAPSCGGSESCQWVLAAPDSNGHRSPWCTGSCSGSGPDCDSFCSPRTLHGDGGVVADMILEHVLDGGR